MRANKAQVASHVAEGDNGHAAWDGVQADMHDVQLATVGTFRHIFETDELLRGLSGARRSRTGWTSWPPATPWTGTHAGSKGTRPLFCLFARLLPASRLHYARASKVV